MEKTVGKHTQLDGVKVTADTDHYVIRKHRHITYSLIKIVNKEMYEI